MSKKVSRIVGGIMLAVAVVFVAVALGHPEMSFPWSNTEIGRASCRERV